MVAYVRAGLLLHIITFMEISLLGALVLALLSTKSAVPVKTPLNWGILCWLTMLAIMCQLDARSRYQNYKRIKNQFMNFGFDRRLLKPLANSRCQRDAVLTAADEMGYGGLCREYYRTAGYRWYHLTPDFLFSNPRFLISWRFWKSTFFVATYPSRF